MLSRKERDAILDVVEDLVTANYDGLAKNGRGGRLGADELRQAVATYGRTLVSPPLEVWSLVDVYEVDAAPGSFLIDVPIWTAEEGRSDLTLSVRLQRKDGGRPIVGIEDLHVL